MRKGKYAIRLEEKNTIWIDFRQSYANFIEDKKKLKKLLLTASIIIAVYFLIKAFYSYDLSWFFLRTFIVGITALFINILARFFHWAFGKWFIHENACDLTDDYVRAKLPRTMKVSGAQGAGKDSSTTGMIFHLRKHLINKIEEEIELIETIAYIYDFEKLDQYLVEHHTEYMTNKKRNIFDTFINAINLNFAFVKPFYQRDFSVQDHIDMFNEIKRNPASTKILKHQDYVFDNGIQKEHFISLLIRYTLLFIRYHYMDNYVIANQPFLEDIGKPAKLFSTRFTNIQMKNAEWPWPLAGGVIIYETETDALFPNVHAKANKSPMESGLRNFKALIRHLLGEDAFSINIGQNVGRTNKTIRELDNSFFKILDMTIVYGGEKRIFFLSSALKWHAWRSEHQLFKITKIREKHIKKMSNLIMKIKRLENTGYLYFDIRVSKSDQFSTPVNMSLKQLLRHDKPIYENYTTRLAFHITDSFGRYATHYANIIAENLALVSKIEWNDVMSWDEDMRMKTKHIDYMDYGVFNKINSAVADRKKKQQKEDKENAKKESQEQQKKEEK